MHRFEHTLPTPAQNLAFDEAMLEWAEEHAPRGEFLRLWESAQPMVVVGRSSRVEQEVDLEFCRRSDVPVLRRSSGGAAIVTGPGCLMYAVVLSFAVRPELKDITRAHAFVLNQFATSLGPLLAAAGTVTCAGTSDLAIGVGSGECGVGNAEGNTEGQKQLHSIPNSEFAIPHSPLRISSSPLRKFSGNSLRVKRTHLLYHGTLLYDFDLGLVGKCLRTPPRQPEYRGARSHDEFIANVPATRQQLGEAVVAAFPMASPPTEAMQARVEPIVSERFENPGWNFEFT